MIKNFDFQNRAYTLGRSLLLLATFLVLLFNNTDTMMSYNKEHLSCSKLPIPTTFCVSDMIGMNYEIMRWIMIVIILIALLGFVPFITGILHWYICYSIQQSFLPVDGGDQISMVITFLLIPITLLDFRFNYFLSEKRELNKYIVNITGSFMLLIKVQVFLIYINAAIERLRNKEWADGTALYYFFSDSVFGIPKWEYQLTNFIWESNLIILITWSVTALEFFLAFNIIQNKATNKIALILGIIFHIFIGLTIGIWTFAIVMIACLILYLHTDMKIFNKDKEGKGNGIISK